MITIVVVSIFVFSVLSFGYLTEPPSQIHNFLMKPRNIGGGYGAPPNTLTYPTEFNVSTSSYMVSFQMFPGFPLSILPGTDMIPTVGISYINATSQAPYTGVTIYVLSATLTIGKYVVTAHHTNSRTSGACVIDFYTAGPNPEFGFITDYDSAGQNYTATYNVTVVPVLHFGLMYFKQSSIELRMTTAYPWFHIVNVTVS